MSGRVFIGEDAGTFKFRVAKPGWNARNCPANQLLFGESFAAVRAHAQFGPTKGGMSFGRVFAAPPMAVCGIEQGTGWVLQPGLNSAKGHQALWLVGAGGISAVTLPDPWATGANYVYAVLEGP